MSARLRIQASNSVKMFKKFKKRFRIYNIIHIQNMAPTKVQFSKINANNRIIDQTRKDGGNLMPTHPIIFKINQETM